MGVHLQNAVESAKKQLFMLSGRVEQNLSRAVKSIETRDAELAELVIESDAEIDQLEVRIEEECLKILALHQPVATDLRFIIALMKINNDLERIGDLDVNIAERAVYLARREAVDLKFDFARMEEKVKKMLSKSIGSLVEMDSKIAESVRLMDDEVDDMNRKMYETVKESLPKHPEYASRLMHMLSVSRHLERIADLATNIAEDVLYMIQGNIVRHKTEVYGE